MGLALLNRARSYLSGGQRSMVAMTPEIPNQESMLKDIDKEMDGRINGLNNVQLLQLLTKVLNPAMDKAIRDAGLADLD
jgi:hypothetical protein